MTDTTGFTRQAPRPTRSKVAIGVAALFALAAASGGIAACGGDTATSLVPGPTVTRTVPAAPVKIKLAPVKSAPVKAAPVKAAALAPSTPAPVATQPAAAPASSAPASMTSSEQQAVDAAQGYLQLGSGFSAYSLLNQLTSSAGNGFSQSDAQFAINDLSPDWDAQAVDAAKGYLELGGFSSTGLAQQLTSTAGNGFTAAQADYAVSQVMPGSTGAAAPATAPAQQPPPPPGTSGESGAQADPWTVVDEYYNYIDGGDYSDAWNLQSPGFQASNGSYAGWSSGYADSASGTVSEDSESGDTVSVNISAVDTATGNTQYFTCSHTVDLTSGLITSGACTQTGGS
jgi:hypothetical protein